MAGQNTPDLFKYLMDDTGADSMYSSPTPLYAADIASKYGDASTVGSLAKALSDPALTAYAGLSGSGFAAQLQIAKSKLTKAGALQLAQQRDTALKKQQMLQNIRDQLRQAGFDVR